MLWLSVACSAAIASCEQSTEVTSVQYGAGAPLGSWREGESSDASRASSAGRRADESVPVAPTSSVSPGVPSAGMVGLTGSGGAPAAVSGGAPAFAGGRNSFPPDVSGASAAAGRPGASAAGGGGRTSDGVAGSPTAGGPDTATTLTSLTFDVTTKPAGGRYQPKNVGAVWIEDSSGKLVKSLEVWAAIRRRHLMTYVSALSGAAVDVTATATLTSHRAHHATWNLKDKSGAVVPPGKYSLVMELSDGTERSNQIEFDTSGGPQTLSPADATSFTAMRLTLQ